MKVLKTLFRLVAALLAFATAVGFIVSAGINANPPTVPVHASAVAASSAILVVRVSHSAQGVRVSSLLLTTPDRVPTMPEDQVWNLDPRAGDRPLIWRALLPPPEVVRA